MPPQEMSEYPRVFGTDGVRGEFGRDYLAKEYVVPLAMAGGLVTANIGDTYLVGRDTRPSGEVLEEWVEEGLTSVGVNVIYPGVITTPGVAYLLNRSNKRFESGEIDAREAFAGGIMLTASHNPAKDNGIKFFGRGSKLPDNVEDEISNQMWRLRKQTAHRLDVRRGKAEHRADIVEPYIDFLVDAGSDIDFRNMHFVVDCADGSASNIAPAVLNRLRAKYSLIHANVENGRNINNKSGATHLETVKNYLLEHGLDFGVAFDGDADRTLFVSQSGRVFDGDQVLHMLARHHKVDGVVTTIMTNMGIEAALREQGIDMHRAKVGDRYVAEQLAVTRYPFGGEQSGHIIFPGEHTTGDGILTMLKVLRVLQESGLSMDQWMDKVQLYPQVLVNVPLSRKGAGKHEEVQAYVEELNAEMAGSDKDKPQGRAFGRDSGTEGLFRLSAERAPSSKDIETETRSLRQHIVGKVETELKPMLRRLKYIEDDEHAA